MNTMIVIAMLLGSILAQGQGQPARPPEQSEPSFSDTIAFLNRSVSADNNFVVSANPCEIEIVQNLRRNFLIPESTYVRTVDAYGVKHYGFKYAVVREPAQFMRVPLSTIDPESVKSHGGFSPEFIEREHPDENPKALERPDLTVVMFGTADKAKTIRTGDSLLPNGTPQLDKETSGGMLVLQSKDTAERFVTALKHAVRLCGGKPSAFPPTPSSQ